MKFATILLLVAGVVSPGWASYDSLATEGLCHLIAWDETPGCEFWRQSRLQREALRRKGILNRNDDISVLAVGIGMIPGQFEIVEGPNDGWTYVRSSGQICRYVPGGFFGLLRGDLNCLARESTNH